MDTECAPLIADLFSFCYERDFMPNLHKSKRYDLIYMLNEKKKEIWPSPMTKPPIPTENSKTKGQHTQTPPKTSITQRLRTDLGRSVGVTSNPTGVVKPRHIDILTIYSPSITLNLIWGTYSWYISYGTSVEQSKYFKQRNFFPLIKYKSYWQWYSYQSLRQTRWLRISYRQFPMVEWWCSWTSIV